MRVAVDTDGHVERRAPQDGSAPKFGVGRCELRPTIRDIAIGALAGRREPDDHALISEALELLRRNRFTLHKSWRASLSKESLDADDA